MQHLTTATLFAAVAAAQGNSGGVRQNFLQWAASQGKNYSSYSEMQMREAVFAFNSAAVDEMNAASAASGNPHAATFKNNFTSDLTEAEFEANFTGARPEQGDEDGAANSDAHLRDLQGLPTSVNWFTAGRVHAVKNQGSCGSCWAFGSNTTLEAAIAIRDSASPVHLSEQELVDCSGTNKSTAGVIGTYSNAGCNGGWMDVAWKYVKYNGISTDAAYPYKALKQTCAQKTKTKVGFVSGWNTHNASTIKAASAAGVVSIGISASPNAFRYYSSGVVQAADCYGTLNHAVVVIGYDDAEDGGNGAWIVQNSWGTGWGDAGRIKFAVNFNSATQPLGTCKMMYIPQTVVPGTSKA